MTTVTLVLVCALFVLQAWHMLRMQHAATRHTSVHEIRIEADVSQAEDALRTLERRFAQLRVERERTEGALH